MGSSQPNYGPYINGFSTCWRIIVAELCCIKIHVYSCNAAVCLYVADPGSIHANFRLGMAEIKNVAG